MESAADKQVRDYVLDNKNMADERRKAHAEKWVNYARLYRNHLDRNAADKYRSVIAVPWPYIIVETYLPKSVRFLLGNLPYVLVIPEEAQFEPNARYTEALVNKQLHLQGFVPKTTRIFKDAMIYGTAFAQIEPWSSYRGFPMPRLMPTRIFDMWVNPYVAELDENQAWITHQTWAPATELKALTERVNQVAGREIYRNMKDIAPRKRDEQSAEQRARIADTPFGDEYHQEIDALMGRPSFIEDKYSQQVQLLSFYSHSRMIVVANENTVIRDTENPVGRIPFKALTPIPAQYPEFYGMSIFEASETQFMELNELRSQRNDARNLMLTPMWQTNDMSMKGKNLISAPGRIVASSDVNLKPVTMDWSLLRIAEMEEKTIEGNIMDATNAFMQVRGAPMARREPATTTLKMQEAGDIRSDLMNLLLENQYVEAIADDFVEFNRMFLSRPVVFMMPGTMPQFQMVGPTQLLGNFSFKAVGGALQAKEIERKQMQEFLMFALSNPLTAPVIAPKVIEWMRRILSLYPNIKNPEQLIPTMDPQQLAQLQSQAMMFHQLMQGGFGQQDQINTSPGRASGGGETGGQTMPEQFTNSPMDSFSNADALRPMQ